MQDPAEQRRHPRVLGPFDGTRAGILDLPLQIYDLSLGGCFINSVNEAPRAGQIFSLRIELPDGGTVVAKGERVFVRPGYGYGVKFCEMSDEHRLRLERALETLQHASTVDK